MKTLFFIIQLLTGMMAVAALLLLSAMVVLRRTAAFVKESLGALGYVVALLTSGFTKGTPPKPARWRVTLPQAGLSLLFGAMLFTLFLPDEKIFLHVVAVLAGVAVIWYARMLMTQIKVEILCLPLVVVWFGYYAMCVFWRAP